MGRINKEEQEQQSKEAAKTKGEIEEISINKNKKEIEQEEPDFMEIAAQMPDLEYRARILAMLNELVLRKWIH